MKKHTRKGYRIGRTSALDYVLVVILGLMALAAIFPFYQVVILSFADTITYANHPLYLLPYAFDLTGYKAIFNEPKFFRSLLNTIFITVVGTALNMTLSVFGAYALSRKYLLGRRVFLNLIIFTMLFSGGLIPTYMVIKGLGLINNIFVMILPSAISTYYLIIMKNYFMSLPESLLEAARIDGLNEIQIFFRMFFPTMRSTYAAAAVITFMNAWNSYLWPKVIMTDNDSMTMPMLIANLITGYVTDYGMLMCGVLFCSIPTMVVFFVLQKQFAEGITGAVK